MCNTALRRDVILSAGGFDEELAWSEDLDLLHRITRNHIIIRENRAIVHHKVPETFSEFFWKRVQAGTSGGEIFAKYGFEFGMPRSFFYSTGLLLFLSLLILTLLYYPTILKPILSIGLIFTLLKIGELYIKSRERAVILFPIVVLLLSVAYLNFFRGFLRRSLL